MSNIIRFLEFLQDRNIKFDTLDQDDFEELASEFVYDTVGVNVLQDITNFFDYSNQKKLIDAIVSYYYLHGGFKTVKKLDKIHNNMINSDGYVSFGPAYYCFGEDSFYAYKCIVTAEGIEVEKRECISFVVWCILSEYFPIELIDEWICYNSDLDIFADTDSHNIHLFDTTLDRIVQSKQLMRPYNFLILCGCFQAVVTKDDDGDFSCVECYSMSGLYEPIKKLCESAQGLSCRQYEAILCNLECIINKMHNKFCENEESDDYLKIQEFIRSERSEMV